ncbi:hypothetical protein [Lysobacter gummosus]|uniref:hypothetical protein n=1 Tax=Lysobacter gummosus TaxID=262324 RepID=UPI0036421E41
MATAGRRCSSCICTCWPARRWDDSVRRAEWRHSRNIRREQRPHHHPLPNPCCSPFEKGAGDLLLPRITTPQPKANPPAQTHRPGTGRRRRQPFFKGGELIGAHPNQESKTTEGAFAPSVHHSWR